MVCEADVFKAKLDGSSDHVLKRSSSVAGRGVAVKCAAKVRPVDEFREIVVFRRIDFAPVLAEFGLNGIKAERSVNIEFLMDLGQGFLELAAFGLAEPVLVERPATVEGARAALV